MQNCAPQGILKLIEMGLVSTFDIELGTTFLRRLTLYNAHIRLRMRAYVVTLTAHNYLNHVFTVTAILLREYTAHTRYC